MTDGDQNMLQYHIMRADQEGRYAATTSDATARTAHRELAVLHDRRADELRADQPAARPILHPSYATQA